MSGPARRITLDDWDGRYAELLAAGLREPPYGGPLRRHAEAGDRRLQKLRLDNSAAALRLWNFLLTEEERLRQARDRGWRILGTMKDLGTIPVMAYALENVVAFYPDGAWWLPCIMEDQTDALETADALGVDESFCPVRAMLGAFASQAHFPIPDLLTCSVGATCDDVSAIAQRLAHLGHSILWWEVPHRRRPEPGEEAVELPGGFRAPASQVAFVRGGAGACPRGAGGLGRPAADRRAAAGRHSPGESRAAAAAANCGGSATRPSRARCPPWKCSSPRCSPSISVRTSRKRSACWRNCWARCGRGWQRGKACCRRAPCACSG